MNWKGAIPTKSALSIVLLYWPVAEEAEVVELYGISSGVGDDRGCSIATTAYLVSISTSHEQPRWLQ